MKTYNNFDEQIFMDIAKSTGNEQIIDDVGYGIYIKHFSLKGAILTVWKKMRSL